MKYRSAILMAALLCTSLPMWGGGITAGFDHSVSVEQLAGVESMVPQSLPLPAYPAEMLRAAINGRVTVSFVVRPDGTVADVSIARASVESFAAPVAAAVKQWRFKPVRPTTRDVPMSCIIVFQKID